MLFFIADVIHLIYCCTWYMISAFSQRLLSLLLLCLNVRQTRLSSLHVSGWPDIIHLTLNATPQERRFPRPKRNRGFWRWNLGPKKTSKTEPSEYQTDLVDPEHPQDFSTTTDLRLLLRSQTRGDVALCWQPTSVQLCAQRPQKWHQGTHQLMRFISISSSCFSQKDAKNMMNLQNLCELLTFLFWDLLNPSDWSEVLISEKKKFHPRHRAVQNRGLHKELTGDGAEPHGWLLQLKPVNKNVATHLDRFKNWRKKNI